LSAAFHPGGRVGDLPPEAKAKLRAELDAARVRYEIEQYSAKHGYAVNDSDVYDHAAVERHYGALDRLYAETLRA
jgi:carboxymethylenebutenolidase